VIEIRVDGLLRERERSFYWLAKETGISHTTLWRLKKGKALGINFETLEKMCRALGCQPGEILWLANEPQSPRRRTSSRTQKKS
jgi:putative transcriptional regulator